MRFQSRQRAAATVLIQDLAIQDEQLVVPTRKHLRVVGLEWRSGIGRHRRGGKHEQEPASADPRAEGRAAPSGHQSL